MASKNVLVATSLFCSQKNWPALLGGIEKFEKTIYKKPSFRLEFNYLSGDNIRFSFLVQDKTADQLLEDSDKYFKSFFSGIKPGNRKQSGELFKNFDENHVYYGLYDPVVIEKSEKKRYQLEFMLSRLIIAALKNEDRLDDETIVTLAYYFAITVIKVAIENYFLSEKMLLKYFKQRYKQLEAFDNETIKAKFKENKAVLLEIYNDLGEKDVPAWIKKWKAFLLAFLQNNDTEIQLKTISIFEQIRTQLGLNNAMESMLCYFIFRTLQSKTTNSICKCKLLM